MVEQWSGAIAQLNTPTDLTTIVSLTGIPTLADVNVAFDAETAVRIVSEHLLSLCKNVDKELTAYQFVDTSLLFVTEYFYLNLAEVSFFFRGCKTGKYGQLVWGQTLNIQQVMTASRTFLHERRTAIERAEKEKSEIEKSKTFARIDTAGAAITVGVDNIRILNEKAKTDFKAFRELFPNLPDKYSPNVWWNAWRGSEDALKAIYGDNHPIGKDAESKIGVFLCYYNSKLDAV